MATQLPTLRKAELIASLSLATDLAMGQPVEQTLRATMLAVRLSDEITACTWLARGGLGNPSVFL